MAELHNEKRGGEPVEVSAPSSSMELESGQVGELKRDLKNRHMQMIAIGGAIGAGLFVGAGGALSTGGPASLVIGFMIVGIMILFTVQALGELAVIYPVNGAFFSYSCRFINDPWGFAMGWEYVILWLVILPFELTAAGITIAFWPKGADINVGVWIAVFLVALTVIQFFGVKAFGEVEFVLSLVKIAACVGFIILGIIIDCGGVPTDTRGYIGAAYWHDGNAFRNGFKGFCSVFVTAAFAFGGTEFVGLCAAEAQNPKKAIPLATRQVFTRITFFYVVGLFILGLVVPSDDPNLLHSSGANTKYSPFVIAIQLAGIKVLPSIFNVVITVSVLSVANSCAFGSTRTLQALAARGMAPKIFAKVDSKGRPIWCIVLQLLFGLLAFVNEATAGSTIFTWLLSLSGLANFFVWGSICFSHIRFRKAWKLQGHSLKELPYKAPFGTIGSWIGLVLVFICLVAQFYVALFPIDGVPDAEAFFEAYLAAPLALVLYLGWAVYKRDWTILTKLEDINLLEGIRNLEDPNADDFVEQGGLKSYPKKLLRAFF